MIRHTTGGVALVLILAGIVAAGDGFEDRLVVKVAKGPHGPRGMPGDFVRLKDG